MYTYLILPGLYLNEIGAWIMQQKCSSCTGLGVHMSKLESDMYPWEKIQFP